MIILSVPLSLLILAAVCIAKLLEKMGLEFSWRLRNPTLLNVVLNQRTRSICWAISIIRQLESLYRLDQDLVRLSVQELVNNIPREMIAANGCLLNLDALGPFLVSNGTVREEICQFTGVVHRAPRVSEAVRYRPLSVKRCTYNGVSPAKFDKMLWEALKISPIAARIISARAFETIDGDNIYQPLDNDMADGHGHMVLITGWGTDDLGNMYWEAQDSYGVTQGQNGIIHIARMDDVVTDFFEMILDEIV